MPEIYFYVLYDFFFCLLFVLFQISIISNISVQCTITLGIYFGRISQKKKKNKKIKIIHTSITKTCLYILTKNKEENMRQNDQ